MSPTVENIDDDTIMAGPPEATQPSGETEDPSQHESEEDETESDQSPSAQASPSCLSRRRIRNNLWVMTQIWNHEGKLTLILLLLIRVKGKRSSKRPRGANVEIEEACEAHGCAKTSF